MLYLDTSALAKLYLAEPDSRDVGKLVERHEPWLFTSVLTMAELLSALKRSRDEERISARAYTSKRSEFLADWKALQVIELNGDVLAPAPELIDRHALRGADAVHLCSALWLGRPDFACSDTRLASAASAEGLPVAP